MSIRHIKNSCILVGSMLFLSSVLFAQGRSVGTVSGVVKSDSTHRPLEFVNVVLLNQPDSTIVTGTVTDSMGKFEIENIPFGGYFLRYSLLGYKKKRSHNFAIDSNQTVLNVGTVLLSESPLKLGEVTVSGQKAVFNGAIDRKVYSVQQDIMSKSGSVSDLLQNIPSVQVDVDGTVSLRGSPNVQILINGRSSPLMASGSTDVLQDIPASSVEKIEVITNPSAKFKPEGTSGIINIVLKKESDVELNGNIGANIGNSSRYNVSASGNYNPGRINIFGSYNFRQDERNTYTSDIRQQIDSTTNELSHYNQQGHAFARPFTHFITLGLEYLPDDADKFGLSGNYRRRAYTSTDTTTYLLTDNNGAVTSDYNRLRIDYDQTPVAGATAFYQHDFIKDDHTLRCELIASHLFDEEDNHFRNIFFDPPGIVTYDNRRIHEYNNEGEFTIDYHLKLTERSVLEAGYDGTFSNVDFPFTGNYFDTTQQTFVTDTALTNHFLFKEAIHALYGTYETTFGALSIMGGLRTESALIASDLITTGTSVSTSYWRLYPTLHLRYKLNEFNELQLNYSLRVNRPGADDLNPFPEYQNPRNLRAGNPLLQPEFIHSIELGCQIQNDNVNVTPSVFYRNRYNGFTTVTKALNDSTLLTTQENLSTDQSGGLELVVTGTVWSVCTLNLNANAFYDEIDASNLGYGASKSIISWNSSLNCNLNLSRGTMIQVNSNYRSSRLTPQGEIHPSFVLNLGIRQNLLDEKLFLTGTVSDIFNTLRRKTQLNTPWLTQNAANSRDSRVIFLGLTYHFGSQPQKSKDKSLEYDDSNS